jgi:hypothetical protein
MSSAMAVPLTSAHARVKPRDVVIVDDERLARSAADGDRLEARAPALSRRRSLEHDEVVADGDRRRARRRWTVAPDENRSLGWVVVSSGGVTESFCPPLWDRDLYPDAAAGAINQRNCRKSDLA